MASERARVSVSPLPKLKDLAAAVFELEPQRQGTARQRIEERYATLIGCDVSAKRRKGNIASIMRTFELDLGHGCVGTRAS
ncbi:MAG: hypothetical protein ACXV97_05870, partial [Chthoniobacterales bacterium]